MECVKKTVSPVILWISQVICWIGFFFLCFCVGFWWVFFPNLCIPFLLPHPSPIFFAGNLITELPIPKLIEGCTIQTIKISV